MTQLIQWQKNQLKRQVLIHKISKNTIFKIIKNKRSYDSPFAQRARENKYRYQGGKQDDITVIVAMIKETKTYIDNDEITRDSSTTDYGNDSVNNTSTNNKNLENSRINGKIFF